MQYALLIYGQSPPEGPVTDEIGEVLARPGVLGWARLHTAGSATTVRSDGAQMLLTDGPFVDSKEYLAGLIVIEADNLDHALAVAQALEEGREMPGAIEVRPIFESSLGAG